MIVPLQYMYIYNQPSIIRTATHMRTWRCIIIIFNSLTCAGAHRLTWFALDSVEMLQSLNTASEPDTERSRES